MLRSFVIWQDYDSDSDSDDEDGISIYYLVPPLWHHRVMIWCDDGHFHCGSSQGHLDVRTGRFHSLDPPYCACSSE